MMRGWADERLENSPCNMQVEENRAPGWKRGLDIVCVLVTCIFWIPAGLFMALYIKWVSPGPVLFKQKGIGYMGREFICLKFRTMVANADTVVHQKHLAGLMASNQPMKKLDCCGDARLIPGSAWLRAAGLDELPQLINVLRGEMSLVGPRPCLAYEQEMFLPRHRGRCRTLPGLTGLWQVKGKNRASFEKMMELDLTYVEDKSLLLDLKIMFCTLPAVLIQVWDAKELQKAADKSISVKEESLPDRESAALERSQDRPFTPVPAQLMAKGMLRSAADPAIG